MWELVQVLFLPLKCWPLVVLNFPHKQCYEHLVVHVFLNKQTLWFHVSWDVSCMISHFAESETFAGGSVHWC